MYTPRRVPARRQADQTRKPRAKRSSRVPRLTLGLRVFNPLRNRFRCRRRARPRNRAHFVDIDDFGDRLKGGPQGGHIAATAWAVGRPFCHCDENCSTPSLLQATPGSLVGLDPPLGPAATAPPSTFPIPCRNGPTDDSRPDLTVPLAADEIASLRQLPTVQEEPVTAGDSVDECALPSPSHLAFHRRGQHVSFDRNTWSKSRRERPLPERYLALAMSPSS